MTGKPADIPQDVWVAADLVLLGNAWNPLRTEAIARAIMAERERCAKIADAHAAESWGMTEEEHAAQVIAALIRAGTT